MNHSETTEDKRSSTQPTSKELESMLSLDQLFALRNLEASGWSLLFIRQPQSQAPVPVVIQENRQAVGILEEDGRLNIDVDIEIRVNT